MSADLATEPTPTEQFGIIEAEPIAKYHASASTSHSKLEVLRDEDRGPARYLGKYILKNIPPEPDTDAKDFGQAFDSALLDNVEIHVEQPKTYSAPESDRKDALMIEKPWNNNAKSCRAWHAQQVGKIVLTAGQIRLIDGMRASLQQHPEALALLTGGKAQLTFRAQYRWFSVQVRPDKWRLDGVKLPGETIAGPVIADLKTAEDKEQFFQNRKNFGYDRQDALYRRVTREILATRAGVEIEDVPDPRFFFVVAYKSAPVDWEVFEVTGDDKEEADREVEADLKWLHRCYSEGKWPGSFRGVQKMPPLWRKQRKEIW